jgi:uncharacterized protein GlcG (DUF336 family)
VPLPGTIAVAVILAAATARADELPRQAVLPAALAMEAVAAAVEACAKESQHVSAAVVDQGGNLRALLRGDGAGPHTVDSSSRKAYTANTLRTSTLELAKRIAANPELADLRRMNERILLLGGGLPIKAGSEVIGGIGVGGTPSEEMDEGCARAGLERIQDRLR